MTEHPPRGAATKHGTPACPILHVDMDAFFASVELLARPELRGQPVIVGGRGDPSRRGVVSTATYEARRFGVHSGMALRTAARLCPEARFLPVDMNLYRRYSEAVFDVLRQVTPVLQAVGLDEAYLDIGERAGDAMAIARDIKRTIRATTRLTASVGVAPNRLLAKIASELEKPDGLVVLTPADVPTRVWPLPVRTLHGVGPRTGERLAGLGIETVGDLARIEPDRLTGTFSPRHAEAMRRAAHGEDSRPVRTGAARKSIGRERTFQVDCRSTGKLQWHAGNMLDAVLTRLGEKRLRARTVTVKIRYRDFVTQTRSVTLPHPTDDPEVLTAAVSECLFQHRLHRAVRLLGVQLSQLSGHADQAQAS